jgi:hypothetical protein
VIAPFIPVGTADQPEPLQRARFCATMPPAFWKLPPTQSAGPLPSSNTCSAAT